jgi:hypothetical protein
MLFEQCCSKYCCSVQKIRTLGESSTKDTTGCPPCKSKLHVSINQFTVLNSNNFFSPEKSVKGVSIIPGSGFSSKSLHYPWI